MVAIKDMEMPERCPSCKFCLRQETNDYGFYGECLLQEGKKVDCLAWSRDDNCPLIIIKDDTLTYLQSAMMPAT
jgi:hypothetical protein